MKNIVLVLILGLILRLISINQSFWLDEATTANVANMGLREILTVFSPGDFHPPLYYLIAHFWVVLFGSSEVAIRMFSVIAGVGTIYVVFLIAKEFSKNWKFPEVAAILLATSGLHIYYSQEARMYALATLFVSLTILYFVKIVQKGRVGEWVGFSLFLGLAVSIDYLPVLVIPALWMYAWTRKLKPLWWKKFFASHIILVGTGLLWLPYFIQQLNAGLSIKSHSPFWWQILGQTNFRQIVLIPTKFIFGRIDMEASLWQIAIAGIVFLFFGFLLFKSLKDIKSTKILWFWLIMPLILGILISFWIPALSYFRFLFVLPAFYLLVATGLQKAPQKLFGVLVVVLVLFNLLTSSLYLFSSKNHREDWRTLAGFVKAESSGKKSAAVFVTDSQQEAYRYYDKDVKILTRETVDVSYDELWLMRYVQDIFDPEDKTRMKIEELGYEKTNEYDFNGVVIWKYSR